MQRPSMAYRTINEFTDVKTIFCCGKDDDKESMFDRRRVKYCVCLMFCIFLCGIIYLGYFCPARVCALTSNPVTPTITQDTIFSTNATTLQSQLFRQPDKQQGNSMCTINNTISKAMYLQGSILHQNFTITDLTKDYRFDIDNDRDVLVFLHMQKTGGTTFGTHLVKNIRLNKACVCHRGRKRCDCENKNGHVWLFSRYSTGWRCGLHADWTELTSCVDVMLNKIEDDIRFRRFLYITVLRDPYYRYISEYKHVHRGATWKSARLQCDGRQASLEEVPFCFDGEDDWSGVTVDEFLDCPYNLANNRQTRMLANLSLSGCYGNNSMLPQQRDCIMLNSAKRNLRQIAFFGLTEYQQETQYLFERTFGLEFIDDFYQYNQTHASEVFISEKQKDQILQVNQLDIELYQYAKDLFFQRLSKMREIDADLQPGSQIKVSDRKRSVRSNHHSRHGDDYEEGDENSTDDDTAYNHRIAEQPKRSRKHHMHRKQLM